MIGEKLGPYEILTSLGSGGMGEVWKARDTRLGRIVAIKKVKEQHSERFKHEARSIAALNHPNICQIHDIGPDYLVLEYVAGKPLPNPLPEKEAIRLAIQIAAALEAAHKKGIIHRDLKPSNIMVNDEGSAKLLDFGLAKLYEQDASISNLPTEDMPPTQAGAVLGTVAYMSPEQAQGQPADARSDIFAFGLVLYEMLSGRRAFAGDSPLVIGAALIKEAPPPLQASPSIEKIVKRCLEKNPSDRYQTASEVRAAFEKLQEDRDPKHTSVHQQSIAVLPFVNMSGDKEQEYFSDGLAEEVINALTKIPGLKVAGRTSSFYFRGKDVEFSEIGKKLNVEHILEGSVRKSGKRIRITAQLIKVADGFHLWSERYDRDLTDVFAIQDEISHTIVEKLRVNLAGEKPLIKRHTENVEAYSLYLKGRYYFYKAVPKIIDKSKENYEKAIAADPNYALAWYGLAKYYWYLGYAGFMPPKTAQIKSHQAAVRTLELNETLAEAHGIMGSLRALECNWKEAEREFRSALELNPESEDVCTDYVFFYLMPMRRPEEAIVALQKSLERDPLSLITHNLLGYFHYIIGQWDKAIEHWRNALEIDPQFNAAHWGIGLCYIEKGLFDDGIRELETTIRLFANLNGFLGAAYARAGRAGEARKLLEELHIGARKQYVPHFNFALIHFALGEIDQCFDWLEKAVDEQDAWTFFIIAGTVWDSLHSHPRWNSLLKKMNLEP